MDLTAPLQHLCYRDGRRRQRLSADHSYGIPVSLAPILHPASVRSDKDSIEKLHGNISFSAKGLARNQQAMSDLMQESLQETGFAELPRLRELVSQIPHP